VVCQNKHRFDYSADRLRLPLFVNNEGIAGFELAHKVKPAYLQYTSAYFDMDAFRIAEKQPADKRYLWTG
jgi:hypothetical protein